MGTNDNAFTLDTSIPEETLIDLTRAVDALDNFRMVVHGTLTQPVNDRALEDYIKRAILYLQFLRERAAENDLFQVSTIPVTESASRRRISRLLRSSMRELES